MRVLFGMALFFFGVVNVIADKSLLPEVPRGIGEMCVEPTEVMRKFHMDFLFHQRDATVHNAVRDSKHSLIGCIDCHVGRDAQNNFIDIDAPGQFCASCHEFAGVAVDCFECHAAKPDGDGHVNTVKMNE